MGVKGLEHESISAIALERKREHAMEGGSSVRPNTTYAPRYQLTDGSTASLVNVSGNGYSPLSRSGSPGTAGPHPHTALSPTTPTTPIPGDASRPPRSAGPGGTARYGPLGPLDPAAAF